ncbi:bifunctional hydroxymethylpyrimidine kinase/phosphomethylpyrimidine kinase [Herbiconiux ginsengi]|uniref:Hydroxymethylpyrimidine/phosphomethylpyrimidine kinase/hydroxymethylpyrimidine kinase / phosphomethylpyrimidine kinase / thiamine-phosphate diphosphorylase n=1 Tax=Herbiconiux ginsengi TaxID=381665 RepID=A0A1H3TLB3_9MICO|nr:bifunctional hydroxymethylpyrimidine kinase/phosphomethylpyrimidine kinase [Herbiconiux ginsengi]SDZ50435.1 hydroxymethylpyrimidine/phosphomethylpyrimidine kinase/hydroxymethylpyrimidine kinase / phosphomethylpyrimidine kinase / thiamine-phosphate diphosphorylase [Herbiconiux ginsengi]
MTRHSSAAIPRVLSIAGTDPTGGAGIQADLKSIAALGGYGMAVVTALVAQNTRGVRSVHVPPAAFLREQLDAVSDDVEIDAVKIGMLANAELAGVVSEWLAATRPPLVVLDPVIVATSGDRLLRPDGEATVRRLCGQADLVTPNLAELGVLVGEPTASEWAGALEQGARLARSSGATVLVKGGHLAGPTAPDALVWVHDGAGHRLEVAGERIATRNTHGTGCSLSSAMATLGVLGSGGRAVTGDDDAPDDHHATAGQAATRDRGLAGDRVAAGTRRDAGADGSRWLPALRDAKAWLSDALRAADALQVGRGNGPIDHSHATRRAPAAERARVGASGLPADAHEAVAADASCRDMSAAPDAAIALADAPLSAALWRETATARAAIDELAFVRGLGDGTLDRGDFEAYLAQDVLYLGEYARVLARASQLAPTPEEQIFWATSAAASLAEEARLHHERLQHRPAAAPSATTLAYVNHLHAVAAHGDYAELVAALLPCFWVYTDLGTRLATRRHPAHPFDDWLASYADPAFALATEQAIGFVDAAAHASAPARVEAMRTAFLRSVDHEHAFFAQPFP